MSITERHERILNKLKNYGKVNVQDLSAEFEVSDVTIRKDLRILEDKGLLFRTHGGATLSNPYAVDRSIDEKENIKSEEKESIGRAAVDLIGENDSIIIGSGTTMVALARHLNPSKDLNVITSALNVSLELIKHQHVNIIQLGGQIRASSASVVGSYAEGFLQEIVCGILFLGVDGVDLDYGITTTNLLEARLNQRFIEAAQVTVVLADSSKFGKRGFGRICDLDEVQYLITDPDIPDKSVRELEERGIKVIIAE